LDEILVQALRDITDVLESFLPTPAPGVTQRLLVTPKKVKPTGLGGYVGVNVQPHAALYGRYIHALSEVSLSSVNGLDSLHLASNNVINELLSQDRATLRNNGIFKINLETMSDITHSGSGSNAIDSRSLRFTLEFEFIPLPAVFEGHIGKLEYNLELASAAGKATFYQIDFANVQAAGEDPLGYFHFLDDPDITATSPAGTWGFDFTTGSIHQSEDVGGGGTTLATARKAGTQALLLKKGQPYLSRNMILKAELFTGDTDGIGFVFRWLDENNFYYYLMSARNNYHVIGKKTAGNYAFLEQAGLNETLGFAVGQTVHSRLIIEGEHFQVYMNENFVLSGSDGSLTAAGRVGFLSHHNEDAHFLNLQLIRFAP
jgi:hypothetical protein